MCEKQGPANQRDKDLTKTTSDLSEDLFKVHDFDVKIDLQVPSAGECVRARVRPAGEGPACVWLKKEILKDALRHFLASCHTQLHVCDI